MSSNTLLTSILNGGANSHATVAEEANAYATDFVSAGVVGSFSTNLGSGGTGSFCVNADASPDMGVTIKAGQAYVTATPSGQGSQVLRVRAAADYTAYTINANASGSTKYDWIYLSISATNANTPSAAADNVASFVTSRSSSNTADNGTPPTYGILLAIVTVANAASSITNSNVVDMRTQASVSTSGTPSTTGWNTGLTVPNTVAYNGNHSYTLTVNGTDLTGTVSAGMRLRTTRLVAAPTQCTSLNGTTQYYNKASPAGMTFTGNFSVSAWVKLSSYPTTSAGVISRDSAGGTLSGWELFVSTAGVVTLYWRNASGNTNFSTSQSLPINKWVHIAAVATVATPTIAFYIDGILAPGASAATAATTVVQASTNLTIGNRNSTNGFFPGELAQVAVYSAAISQANIVATISQGLSGSETSLISAYSFNNSINDLNANANNLTANGSAVATSADSPFGGQASGSISSTLDYGVITSASFSTNTTLVVQVAEGCTIPTSGGVSAVSYAVGGTPYGFPRQTDKFTIAVLSESTANLSNSYANNGTIQLSMPVGPWNITGALNTQGSRSSTSLATAVALSESTSATTVGYEKSASRIVVGGASGTILAGGGHIMRIKKTYAATTIIYIVSTSTGGGGALTGASDTQHYIEAECAYL